MHLIQKLQQGVYRGTLQGVLIFQREPYKISQNIGISTEKNVPDLKGKDTCVISLHTLLITTKSTMYSKPFSHS